MSNRNVSFLTSALKDLYSFETYIHSWTGITDGDTPSVDIEAIYVQGIGTLKFPPTLENIVNDTDILTKQDNEAVGCRIDGSKIFPIPKGRETVAQMTNKLACYSLEKMLNIDLTNLHSNFCALLDALVICQNGQSYKNTLAYRREPGGFATLILQIPLENSQPSGCLVLRDGCKEIKTENLVANGQTSQYVALLSSSYDCDRIRDYFIQAESNGGVVLAMVFNLIWTEYFGISRHQYIDCYPQLLIIADSIAKELLLPRNLEIQQEAHDCNNEGAHGEGSSDTNSQVEEAVEGDEAHDLSDCQDIENQASSDSGEISRYLCIPLERLHDEQRRNIGLHDLKSFGISILVAATSIIKFTEASIGYMGITCTTLSLGKLPVDDDGYFSLTALFSMDRPTFKFTDAGNRIEHCSIGNHPSTLRIYAEQIITTPWCDRYPSLDSIPALIVRQRRSSFKCCFNALRSNCEKTRKPIVGLLENVENRLTKYEVELVHSRTGGRQPAVLETLLKNFNFLVDELDTNSENLIDSSSTAGCTVKCLLFRILNICSFLKTPNQGFAVLENLPKKSDLLETLDRDCGCCDCTLSAVFRMANFLTFACRDSEGDASKSQSTENLIRLVKDNLCNENCYDYAKLGIHLFYQGCVEEAQFIFNEVLSIMAASSIPLVKLDSEGCLCGTNLLDLASYLCSREEDAAKSKGTFEQVLALTDNTTLSSLTALVEHLGKSIETGRLHCNQLLIKLGSRIIERDLQQFTKENYLRVIEVYEKGKEHNLVKLFWEKVCSDCIAKSDPSQSCLFCSILRETIPESDECDGLLKTLSRASNANHAITSSCDKLNRIGSIEVITAGCFVYSVSVLNDETQLSDETRLSSLLNNVLQKFENEALCDVAWLLFTSKTGFFNKHSTVRRVFERTLRRIPSEGLKYYFSIFKAFRMFTWLGDLDLLKTIYKKISPEISPFSEQGKDSLRLIFSAMKARSGGNTYDAASALTFSRKAFNFLLSKCLANIEILKFARVSYFVRAFKSFLAAEKNFIDSSEPHVTNAFSRVVQRLEPYEAMKILKLLYLHERKNAETEPSLKKFPPCWRVFQELSRKAIGHFSRQSFTSARFVIRDAVTLMHCFLYIGEKELIVKFCDFVEEQCDAGQVSRLSNMERAIISHPKTVPLALTTSYGILAINELIDNRIRRLSSRPNSEKEFRRLKTLRRTILLRLTHSNDE